LRVEPASQAYPQAFEHPPPEQLRRGPTGRIESAYSRIESLNPGLAYLDHSWDLVRHLFRGLISVGRSFEIVPDLAEAFEIARDGLSYRFRLRTDARWSDGTPLTADDFAYAWRRIREDSLPTAFLHEDIESGRVLDDHTLEVRLREPRNYFLYLLAEPTFFAWPRHVCQQLGSSWCEPKPE